MQIKSLRIKSYKSCAVNDTASAAALERLKKLELYDKLQSEGCCRDVALEAIGWSRATLLPLVKALSATRLVGVRNAKLSSSNNPWATVDKATGTSRSSFAQALSAVG